MEGNTLRKYLAAITLGLMVFAFTMPMASEAKGVDCIKLWVKAKWGKEIVTGVVQSTVLSGNGYTSFVILLDKPTKKKGFLVVTALLDNIKKWKWISCDDVLGEHGKGEKPEDD
jgi:hypothetical protein